MKTKILSVAALSLTSVTIFSGLILSSSIVSADNSAVDDISIVVPAACTISGTGTNSHNATVMSNSVTPDIGSTTLKAFCNDRDGFAIYAIGYTDNIEGKNVLTSSALGPTHDIVTGAGTSGNSQWAMKLATISNPEPTYPISIQNGYDSYHAVPDDYELVAKRTSNTDTGVSAIGSTLTSTYQVYVSPTQPAGTYVGQVKYVMVHPNYIDYDALKNAVVVNFNGNGYNFSDESTTNTVKYSRICKSGDQVYEGNNYEEVMTSNISAGGTSNGAYTNNELVYEVLSFPGADKVKVVYKYRVTSNTIGVGFVGAAWDGNFNNFDPSWDYYELYYDDNSFGTNTYLFESDTVTIYSQSWGTPEPYYDYGFYVKVYPIYNTEQPNTTITELPGNDCSTLSISGIYEETTEWNGKWLATINGTEVEFAEIESTCGSGGVKSCEPGASVEESLIRYIEENYPSLQGSTITLYSFNPVTFDEVYESSNKTKVNGYYAIQDLNSSMCEEVTAGEMTTVIDIRDDNTYEIGKLGDGNCWLRNNLRLDPTDSSTAANMSASNTNASNEAIYNYLNGGNANNNTYWTNAAVSSPSDWPSNTSVYPYISVSENSSYGTYYNYCAATIGTFCTSNQIVSADISSDVCPVNWRLPTLTESLSRTLNSSSNSLNLPRSGYYYSGYPSNETDYVSGIGTSGFYWTKDVNGYKAMVYMHGRNNVIEDPSGGYDITRYRYSGNTIRCILSTSD